MNHLSGLWGALLSLLLVTPGFAQAQFVPHDEGWVSLQPYPAAAELRAQELSSDAPAPLVHRSICIDLPRYPHRSVESSASFVRQITPTHVPAGSLVIRYEGFQRFAVKRLQSRYRSYWRKQMGTIARDSFINPMELGRMHGQMADAWGDMYTVGNWWDRTWEESLPPEKGGAPLRPYVHTVGQELTILEWGPLTIKNTMKARVSRIELLSLEDQSPKQLYRSFRGGKVARDDARLERQLLDPSDDDSEPDPDEKVGQPRWEPITRVAFNFAPEVRRKLCEGVSWRFNARPSIRVSPTINYMEVVREVSLKAEFDLLFGAKRDKAIGFEAEIEYQPEENELEFTIEVALLSW